MKRDPFTMPVVRVEFTLADGTQLVREWTMSDIPPEELKKPPDWLENPSQSWEHPQDPVTLRGSVRAGSEDLARELLGVKA